MIYRASIVTREHDYDTWGKNKNEVRSKFLDQVGNEPCYIGEITDAPPDWEELERSRWVSESYNLNTADIRSSSISENMWTLHQLVTRWTYYDEKVDRAEGLKKSIDHSNIVE